MGIVQSGFQKCLTDFYLGRKCIFCESRKVCVTSRQYVKCEKCMRQKSLKKLRFELDILVWFAYQRPAYQVALEHSVSYHKVTGNQINWHGDIVHPWVGVKSLHIDRFSGYTDYQDFQVAPDPSIGRSVNEVTISNTNLGGNGSYKIWVAYNNGCQFPNIMNFSQFYITGGSRGLGKSVWPEVGTTQCGNASIQNDQVIWSNANQSGGPRLQNSTFKDFVPNSAVGTNYKSPRYN